MAITVAKKYVPVLDKIYKEASKTAVLDGDNTLVREGANVGELVIPKLSMQGLAAYSRNGGYVNGSVDLVWETVKATYDRGRKFTVDALDDAETMGVAFGKLSDEFIRTKVVPEIDAMRIAKYAGTTNIGSATGTLSTGDAVVAAIRTAFAAMDDAEVPADSRYLFITPTLLGLIEDMDTTKSRELINSFADVIKMPQTRMYTAIDLLDGTTSGEEAGGYTKDAAGKDINFMIIEKSAVAQFNKHVAPKIIDPESNADSDGYIYAYRVNSVAQVYDNKVAGIYCHHKA